MVHIKDLNPEYIINEKGEKKSVVLPVAEFEELLEDLKDLADIAERKDEPTIAHEDLVAQLKNDGLV